MPIGLYFAGHNRRQRILVTGASGGIGRELVRQLQAHPNSDVVSLNAVNNQRVDLKDKPKIKAILNQHDFDTIYHLGALNPLKSNRGEDYFETNVQGTENLLEGVLALKKQGKKVPNVFLASSALVYRPEAINLTNFQVSNPIEERALDGTLALAHQRMEAAKPHDGAIGESLLKAFYLDKSNVFYNDSKLLAEMTAGEYIRKGVPVKVGRLVNCYGNGSNQLMNQLVNDVKQGKTPNLQGKDTEPRDYLFCDGKAQEDDVLRLIRAVAEKGKPGEAYNISSGGQFVRTPQAIAALAQGKKTKVDDNSANLDARTVLSNKKLLALGVAPPKTTPEMGLNRLRSHGKGILNRIGQWFSNFFDMIRTWFKNLFKSEEKVKKPT